MSDPQKHVKLNTLTGYDEFSLDVDLAFFIAIKMPNDACVDFTVYEVYGYDATGAAIFDSRGQEDAAKVEPFMHGFIKWDECSNWSPDNWHFCTKKQAMKVGLLFEKLYDIAADMIPNWDGDPPTRC
jgi:hypothetical protein